MWALQGVHRHYHEDVFSKRERNDNLLENMLKCEQYIREIKMAISESSENKHDDSYENSIKILKLFNKKLSK